MTQSDSLKFHRRIRDNVHGTIDITELENAVIDHPIFQRLRRIRQLAFLHYVFPGASHSRFEHSLGAMHLAGVAWQKIRENQEILQDSTSKIKDFETKEQQNSPSQSVQGLIFPTFSQVFKFLDNPKIHQAVRLAALVHDIGHSPFSHSGELFFPTWEKVMQGLNNPPEYLRKFFEDKKFKLGNEFSLKKVRHEIYTLLLLDRIFCDLEIEKQFGLKVEDVACILEPSIKPEKDSIFADFDIFVLCHELISGELDVDRMDYLLRDSKECGVVYGIFDQSRILDSMVVYQSPRDKTFHLGLQYSGLAAFEDFLRARQSMYLQLYFHKTAAASEAMLNAVAAQIPDYCFPADAEAYAKLDDYNIEGHVREFCEKNTSVATQRFVQETLVNLLSKRKLWKRVFEMTTTTNTNSLSEKVEKALCEAGISFEKISSESAPTRLRQRLSVDQRAADFRLIKKDDLQIPRVMPMEDYLELAKNNALVKITRFYAELEKTPDGRFITEMLQEKLQNQ